MQSDVEAFDVEDAAQRFLHACRMAEVGQHEVGAGIETRDRKAQIGQEPLAQAARDARRCPRRPGDRAGRRRTRGRSRCRPGICEKSRDLRRVELDDVREGRLVDFREAADQLGERFERIGRTDQADAAIDLEMRRRLRRACPARCERQKAVAAEESDRSAPAAPRQPRAAFLDEGIERRHHRPRAVMPTWKPVDFSTLCAATMRRKVRAPWSSRDGSRGAEQLEDRSLPLQLGGEFRARVRIMARSMP